MYRKSSEQHAKNQRSKIIEYIHLIPKGRVTTYGEVARGAGIRGGPRLVAAVLRHFSAGVPWHRVVGAGGQIKLAGHEAIEQTALLRREGVKFRGNRVLMQEHQLGYEVANLKRR
jgi:methylated-DNA-protein-cysteine methyltransferase-like protein